MMTTTTIKLGLISAMSEEQAGLIDHMQSAKVVTRGMRDYTIVKLWGVDCVCVLSRLGKAAAAATVATLIERFDVSHVIFTGVAGGVDKKLQIGDIVVAEALVQHDMDASPIFPRFEVPLLNRSHFLPDQELSKGLITSAREFITFDLPQMIYSADRSTFGLIAPQVFQGLIASGDEFIDSQARLETLRTSFPELLAVEMEGAAVAQVCFEFGIPFAVIRTISDSANEHAPLNFAQFIERVAARYAFGIIKRFCEAHQGPIGFSAT